MYDFNTVGPNNRPVKRTLLRNAAQCLECGDVIESTHRHDFRTCSCGNLSVDGGLSYTRRLFQEHTGFMDLDLYRVEEMTDEQIQHAHEMEFV